MDKIFHIYFHKDTHGNHLCFLEVEKEFWEIVGQPRFSFKNYDGIRNNNLNPFIYMYVRPLGYFKANYEN